jgi:hypothetical protein
MTFTKKSFASGIMLLAENFHLNVSQKYSELIFPILQSVGINDEIFQNKIQEIIFTKTKSEFFTLPAAADWLEFFGKKQKTLSVKEAAILECSSALEESRKAKLHEEAITFQNQITNAVIESLGGLSAIQKRMSEINWYKNESFFRKEFAEIWIAFAKINKISQTFFGTEKRETYDFKKYSTLTDGAERIGIKKVNARIVENLKRTVPDASKKTNLCFIKSGRI